MTKYASEKPGMVALQLDTDEGLFICNVNESDLQKIDARETGTHVVIHYAIRLDGMIDGQYELYESKVIEVSSIDFHRSLQGKRRYVVRKE